MLCSFDAVAQAGHRLMPVVSCAQLMHMTGTVAVHKSRWIPPGCGVRTGVRLSVRARVRLCSCCLAYLPL